MAGPPLCRLISATYSSNHASSRSRGDALVGQRLVGRLVHPVDPALHDRVEQGVAVGEVAVEGAGADARRAWRPRRARRRTPARGRPRARPRRCRSRLRLASARMDFPTSLAKRRQSPYRGPQEPETSSAKSTSAHRARTGPLRVIDLPTTSPGQPHDPPGRPPAERRPRRHRDRDRAGRPAHARAGRDGRERRAPPHRHRPRLRPGLAVVGPQRLHARLRRAAPARRPARRRPRPAAGSSRSA